MRKIIPAIASGAAVLAVAGGTFGVVNANKDVALAVDGTTSEITTMKGTVGEVLADRGIVVGEHDLVAPSPDSAVSDGTRIAVQFGRQLTVTVDGKPRQVWTTARTVGEALNALQLNAAGSEYSTSRSTQISRQGLKLDVATLKSITVREGKKTRVIKTTATTVADALDDAEVTLDSDDELSVPRSAAVADGTKIRVVNVTTKTQKTKDQIAFSVTYKNTDSLTKGSTSVNRAGKSGIRTTRWTVVRKDGKITSKKKISSKITTKPVSKIVLVGTKKKVESSGSNFAGGSTVWDRLAKCESGGNWAIHTGNGYSGGLQFSASTWRAYGGSGQAWQNSRATQINIAEKIRADVGYSAWPACSRKLGLR